MPMIAPGHLSTPNDGAVPKTEPILISVPDAARLVLLQSRFVKTGLKLKSQRRRGLHPARLDVFLTFSEGARLLGQTEEHTYEQMEHINA